MRAHVRDWSRFWQPSSSPGKRCECTSILPGKVDILYLKLLEENCRQVGSETNQPAWVADLRRLLLEEFGEAPRVAMLATSDHAGAPHVRCIVIRNVGDNGSMLFATDARSDKAAQMDQNGAVEVLFWFSRERVQVRIAGEARPMRDLAQRERQWGELSAGSRAMFTWPPPGMARSTSAAFSHPPPQFAPSNFAVYQIIPASVDHLSLRETPHVRWLMRAQDDWHPVAINP